MRKAIYAADREAALACLRRQRFVHLATTDPDGQPILRALHAIVLDDMVAFHGAAVGEKTLAVGRPAVVSAEEVVAEIPSWFVDPERACPATTYYESAQVHGTLRAVDDPADKARVLAALMSRYQPEGGYAPIDADAPLYRAAVQSIGVLAVPLTHVTGKRKLGQNRRPAQLAKILEHLWARGGPGDVAAIDRVREANPAIETPSFLTAPAGARLRCQGRPEDLPGAVALVEHEYWNVGIEADALPRAHLQATAWVVATDEAGEVIATARGLTDGGKVGFVFDVAVAETWRGRGLGLAVVRLVLDHPAMRRTRQIRLGTRDAQALYRRLGFVSASEVAPWPRYESMVRLQVRMQA